MEEMAVGALAQAGADRQVGGQGSRVVELLTAVFGITQGTARGSVFVGCIRGFESGAQGRQKFLESASLQCVAVGLHRPGGPTGTSGSTLILKNTVEPQRPKGPERL